MRLAIPKQCPSQKIPFPTRGEAQAFERTHRKKHGGRQEAYKCRRCPAWHLTTEGHR